VVALAEESYPGQQLGLPAHGRGSLAGWGARIGALVLDWAVCTGVAVAVFGPGVLTAGGWRGFMTLTVFFVESTMFAWLLGGSLGQLGCRIAVVRLDRQPLGIARAALRAALVCLALPALIIGPNRRTLADLAAATIVINRR
jgi:uncharacterized RDD family membrane protein YckC